MGRNPKPADSDALSNLKALEDRVRQVVDVVRETSQENASLTEKLHDARSQIQTLESEIRELKKNQKIVRTRVEGMIRQIAEVERATLKDKEKRVV